MHVAAQTLSLTTKWARPSYERPSLPLKRSKVLVLHENTPDYSGSKGSQAHNPRSSSPASEISFFSPHQNILDVDTRPQSFPALAPARCRFLLSVPCSFFLLVQDQGQDVKTKLWILKTHLPEITACFMSEHM